VDGRIAVRRSQSCRARRHHRRSDRCAAGRDGQPRHLPSGLPEGHPRQRDPDDARHCASPGCWTNGGARRRLICVARLAWAVRLAPAFASLEHWPWSIQRVQDRPGCDDHRLERARPTSALTSRPVISCGSGGSVMSGTASSWSNRHVDPWRCDRQTCLTGRFRQTPVVRDEYQKAGTQ
jgi:hypothetical protein